MKAGGSWTVDGKGAKLSGPDDRIIILEKVIWKKGEEMLLKIYGRHLFDNGGESFQPETGEGISIKLCERWQQRGIKGDWPLSCRASNHLEYIALVTLSRAPSLRIWVNVTD